MDSTAWSTHISMQQFSRNVSAGFVVRTKAVNSTKRLNQFISSNCMGHWDGMTALNAGVRRCAFGSRTPNGAKRLMVPPQRRKAADTMLPPYSTLWSAFRGSLGHNVSPINRLACFGYGFADEHVNAVIEGALARDDFTLLIFTKALSDPAWCRWSVKSNTIVVTETRCSLKGTIGPGHPALWQFERICQEV